MCDTCTWYMHVNVQVCVLMYIRAEARAGLWVFYFVALHYIFQTRVSH